MTCAMEFHDSVLLELERKPDGTGHALFKGSVFKSEGVVFRDDHISGWQLVRFLFKEMSIEGQVVEFGQYASNGELWVNGENENGIVMLQSQRVHDVCMELQLAPTFETVKIHGSEMASSLEGEFEIEFLWDSHGDILKPSQQ